jgi:hypothetical protein
VTFDATTDVRDRYRRAGGRTLCAEFDDCEVSVGLDTTTLHAEALDQAALIGLVLRIVGLGLELIHVHRLPSAMPT